MGGGTMSREPAMTLYNPPVHLYHLPTKGQVFHKHRTKDRTMPTELEILNELNSVDLSKVETSFPMLASGVVTASVVKCEFRRDTERKGDDAKPYCYVEYTLAQPWKTVEHDGIVSRPIGLGERGAQFNERVYVGKYNDKQTNEEKWYGLDRLAKLREAAFGKASAGARFTPEEMVGQTITLRLKFDPAPRNKDTGEVYGPRTSVDGYLRKAG